MNSKGLRYVVGVGAIVTTALAGGCAHEAAVAAPTAPRAVSQTTTTSAPQAHVQVGRSDLAIAEALIEACKIELGNVQSAPKFDFDQASLGELDRAVLDKLAECVTVGRLKGHVLHLVGRADPRGEQEYNMTLGSSRAASVGHYLEGLGVPREQVSQSSRGKLDAVGTDEASWQRDRRVDID